MAMRDADSLWADIPGTEVVKEVLARSAAGEMPSAIAAAVFGHWSHAQSVNAILADPDRFDSYVDEVAISRLFDGDTTVWAGMTHRERRVALQRARDRRQAENADRQDWTRIFRSHASAEGGGGTLDPSDSAHSPDWARRLAAAAGYSGISDLFNAAARMERRGGRVAA